MPQLLASSPTLDGIQECIRRFYCGTETRLEPDGDSAWHVIRCSDGKLLSVRVIKKGKRYRFESLL